MSSIESLGAVVTGAGQTSPHVAGDDEDAAGVDTVGVFVEPPDGTDDGEEVAVGEAEQPSAMKAAIARARLMSLRIANSRRWRKGQTGRVEPLVQDHHRVDVDAGRRAQLQGYDV